MFESKQETDKQLCFDPNAFIDKAFSIDKFLRDHRNKATLEVLRDDLGTYLKTLRLSMIDLINKDYEDFVNLSKDLVGLTNGIDVLETPLLQIKSQVMVVKTSIEETIAGLVACLEHDHRLKEQKQCLMHLSQVITSLAKLKDLLAKNTRDRNAALGIVERAGAEYSVVIFSLEKCSHLLSSEQKEDAECISKLLLNLVCNTFLECVCDQDFEQLGRVMRVFVSIDKVSDMEKLVKDEIVAPFLHGSVREAADRKDVHGLRTLFEKVLNFVDSQLTPLVAVSKEHGSGKVNFIVSSLWTEFERRLEVDLSYIFSVGEPDVFRCHHSDCVALINALLSRCGSSVAENALLNHPQTQRFRQKWNLLVYFKIRYQEIASEMECACSAKTETPFSGGNFRLEVPAVTFMCIQRCWDDQVFIPDVAHLFWKLSLQLISRYYVWLCDETSKDTTMLTEGSNDEQVKSRLKFFIDLYVDSETLAQESKSFLMSKPQANYLSTVLADSMKRFEDCQAHLTRSIVNLLVRASLVPLAHVKDIPRLFRRTNRDMPSKPSEYVNSILNFPTEFYASHQNSIPLTTLNSWMNLVFCEISQQFYSSVDEVLTNAQKTEESLRRLKKAKDRTAGNADLKGASDDDKIRQQLVMDVERFCEGAEALQLKRDTVSQMTPLINLVATAKKKAESTALS